MHRICKLIHTDLKLENCIVDLTDEQLLEIEKTGTLKQRNLKQEDVVKTMMLQRKQQAPLLSNVDTTGMSKNQKKKMKKKIKKQIDTEITNLTGGVALEKSDRKPRNHEQKETVMKTEMSESEEEEKPMLRTRRKSNADEEDIERPRSNSLPNLVLVPEPSMAYMFDTSRNFQEELEAYFSKKA